MTTPSFLLLAMGLLGAVDIVVFHTWTHQIRGHVACRFELITHALRGPTYAALFVLVPNLTLDGAWFALLVGILLFDVGISIADFWLEPASRAGQGGLPRGEYVLHTLLAMLFGALVSTILADGAGAWDRPTDLRWIVDGPPIAVRVVLGVMAPVVLVSGVLDWRAFRRLSRVAR